MTTASEAQPLWSLFGTGPRGVLVTVKRDGRPQLSNVGYLYDHATQTVLISVTNTRAKTRNLQRDPRASFHVSTPDLGAYAVGEGIAELSPVAQHAQDAVVDQLVDHYRTLQGEHPDWADFRAAMVQQQRLLLKLPLTHVYGWNPYYDGSA
jgi:PPOX class probable F420-dependent enzyme